MNGARAHFSCKKVRGSGLFYNGYQIYLQSNKVQQCPGDLLFVTSWDRVDPDYRKPISAGSCRHCTPCNGKYQGQALLLFHEIQVVILLC